MNSKERGFSLIELMVAMVVMLVVVGGILGVVDVVNQRSYTEQAKLDMFQEAREFMDQMSRDLRQAGYPSTRNFSAGVLTTPSANDPRVGAGLIKVDEGELWFEGDVDGTGTVSVVHYWLDPSTSNNCPCLKRSQLPKISGDPITGQTTPAYQTEVQNVQNASIFSAFLKFQTGTPLALPIAYDTDATTIAGVDTIQAVLTVQSHLMDAQTRTKPVTTLAVTVKLNNCSLATNGEAMSCN